MKTKDGQSDIVYSFDRDKLYKNSADFRKDSEQSNEVISIPVISGESGSAPRKKLYKVTGPSGQIYANMSTLSNYLTNSTTLSFMTGATAQPLGDKIYLEGIMYYFDQDCGIIVYLDQLGKKSNRIMTCVDVKTGSEKWTVQPDDMFSKMKIDENKDSFSSLFFTKDKIKVRRSGNVVVLELKGQGLIGFDYTTGKKLWTLDI